MAYTTIDKPTDYFNTVLWTGNTDTTRNITGVGFQPDWVWVKNRSLASDHRLANSVSGANKGLVPNGNDAEDSSTTAVKSFLSDGIQVGNEQSFNRNGDNHVGWFWLCNGGTTSSNTDGSITSNVSVNSTSGFSIVSYTGTGSTASVGHGLGSKPDLIISKIRSAGDWNVYHDSFALNERIKLNSSGASNTNTSIFSSLPTSSVVHVGNGGDINSSSGNHLFFCFKSVKGYSKFGSYRGNGNSSGTFVYTGFRPAFFIIKRTDSADGWLIGDSKRLGYNNGNYWLEANVSDNEDGGTADRIDMLSNGLKMRNSWTKINASGGTYIYMAFAEFPFVTSTGIPTTAR